MEDAYTRLAEQLDITREAAKAMTYQVLYGRAVKVIYIIGKDNETQST